MDHLPGQSTWNPIGLEVQGSGLHSLEALAEMQGRMADMDSTIAVMRGKMGEMEGVIKRLQTEMRSRALASAFDNGKPPSDRR